MPKPFSRELPWVQVEAAASGFVVSDTRTGERARVRTVAEVRAFALAHSGDPGKVGLGDAVHAVTRAIGLKACPPCMRRKAALNRLVPSLGIRRRG